MLQWTAMYAHFPSSVVMYLSAGRQWLVPPGRVRGAPALLGCIGYGSVFLLTGALFRNPIFPAAGILIWESINSFLPPLLQKFSVIYYLKSLVPDRSSAEYRHAVFTADGECRPDCPGFAIVRAFSLFTALVLVIAALQVRRMEINYGTD